MKTNLFRVKKVKEKEKKITLEEEQLYNPILLFFNKFGCLGILFFFLLILILLAVVIITVANLLSSEEGDGSFNDDNLAFEYGDNNVVIDGDSYDEDWISRYANVYKNEGIIFVVKTFQVNDATITYYSDGSSKLIRKDGTIVRISALIDGSYGILEDGTIVTVSKRKSISIINKMELDSGTVIVYYSDGSAEIIKDDVVILVRNSSRINLKDNDYDLDEVVPSGSSYPESVKKIGNYELTYYTDGTIKVVNGSDVFIVRNDDDISIDGDNVTFPNNNQATVVDILKLRDGTIVTYYSDGSALIDTYYDTVIMVRRSGSIILDDLDSFYEILEGDIAFAVYTKIASNGDEVTYYDDGSAVIRYADGTSVYIPENSNIKYDSLGNISKIVDDISDELRVITTPDGTVITEFENGKSRIETLDGKDYIVDTEDILIDSDGNLIVDEYEIKKYNPRDDEEDDSDDDDKIDDDDDEYVNDDDDELDGDVTGTINLLSDNLYVFSINNDSKRNVNYKLVVEESSNYDKVGYQDRILPASYIKYDLVIEDKTFDGLALNNNIWNVNDMVNYVLYEGTLSKKESLDNVMLYLYFDYKDMDNSMQDRLFMGTIRLYIEEEK